VQHLTLRRLVSGLIALVVAVTGLVALGQPASAVVPVAPSGLSPNGSEFSGIPTLSWTRGSDATSYDVQFSASPTFSPVSWGDDTVNTFIVPTAQPKVGVTYWRVRARNASGAGEWTTASFTRGPVDAPVVSSPADGASLQQPGSPPVFTWQPISGVDLYTLEISPDNDFTDPSRYEAYATPATTFVLPDLQLPQTYYWRVKGRLAGANGFDTPFSSVHSYTILGLSKPNLGFPVDDINNNIQDVVLDWAPVHGAATYELQISTDVNFLTIVASQNGIRGTRYSPPETLNNDQYYWRVRGVDPSGNKPDWSTSSVWRFKRNWPHQPSLQWPANGAVVGQPFYYQWSGVKHASTYTIQLSSNSSFTSFQSCTTVHTTFTPFAVDAGCTPGAAGTYYWRVRATDETKGVVTDVISAEVRSFTYSPEAVTMTSPADGASVDIPRLTWEPFAGASKYRVTITNVTGGTPLVYTTAATELTPRARRTVGETYRWMVQPVDEEGRLGASLLPGSQPTFTVLAQPAPTATTPEPTGPTGSFVRFPTLTWTPVVGADKYVVYIRVAGTIGYTAIGADFGYPEGQDYSSSRLAAGDYEWRVDAYSGSVLVGEGQTTATFSIESVQPVTGYEAAIGGNQLTGNAGTGIDACAASLPAECQNLRQTPVLSWEPDGNTGYYLVWISRDAEMTNIVAGPIPVVGTMWSRTGALPDSQAGSAYFWTVQPCKTDGICTPLEHSTHAFNKMSNQVELLTPANGATVQDDVSLSWEDFLATQAAADTSQTVLSTPARTEALSYRVQTATDPNFQSVIETSVVDQMTFTSFGTTYPEGPVYWRVQAIDGSGNPLAWSEVRSFQKQSPTPVVTSPAQNAVINGNEPFTWAPLDYAASYDVEIYKNNDQIGNAANRVVSASVRQIALSLPKPLAPDEQAYTWRVRRTDASGRKGAWSGFTSFSVVGVPPVLVAPAPGATVAPRESVFSWLPVARAAKYRFERRRPGSSSPIVETSDTPALAWAPTAALAGGDWQWRITAIDASNQVLGLSEWRDFKTIDPPTANIPVSISGSGQIGTALTAFPPTWNLPDVVTTYQWLREGKAIAGATGELYTIVSADLGKKITVRATGTKLGYLVGTSSSNMILGALGAPILASSMPLISGVAKVGKVLTATTGTWPGAPKYTYQWLRNGTIIKDADASTYTPNLTDANRKISVRVTATTPGYQPGTATSASLLIAKMRSTGKVTLLDDTIKKTERATVTLSVHVNGNPAPTGKVKLYRDKVLLKTIKLTGAMDGALVTKLPRLGKGKFKIWIKYQGNYSTKKSVSPKVVLKVVR
jgi:hypothetical protein